MVTIGSQASGETGRNTCTSGFTAPFTVRDRPQAMPSGTATMMAMMKPKATVFRLVTIWSR